MKTFFVLPRLTLAILVISAASAIAGDSGYNRQSAPRADGSGQGKIGQNDEARVVIDASREEKKATLRVAKQRGRLQYEFKASTPWDEKDGDSVLSSLDGLSQGTTVSLGLSANFGDPNVFPGYGEKLENMVREAAITSDEPGLTNADGSINSDKLSEILARSTAYIRRCSTNIDAAVKSGKMTQAEAEKARAKLRKINKDYDALAHDYPIHTVGLEGNYGPRTFKWIDSDTLEDMKSNRETYLLTAFYGYCTANEYLFTLGYSLKKDYQEQDEKTLTEPINGTVATSERTAPFGSPEEKGEHVAFVEMRKKFDAIRTAISPKVSYDIEDDVTQVDLKVWLVPNKDGLLTSGVNVGWRSDTDEVTAAVFIGTAFDLFD